MTVKKSMQTSEGKKNLFQIKKGTQEWRYATYVNPTPMSLPSLLFTKFTSNDIGVELT